MAHLLRYALFASLFAFIVALPCGGAFAQEGGAGLQAASGPELAAQSGGLIASGTWGTCPWEIDADGVLTVHPGEAGASADDYRSCWYSYRKDVKAVRFVSEGGQKVVVDSCRFLLRDMSQAELVDLSGLDTSGATLMGCMFEGCSSLASLDLSGLDTSRVEDMNAMFYGCSSLASLDLSGLDTSSVTNMEGMFSGCSKLASLDLSGLDVSGVVGMRSMFYGCSSLASLDLSGLDASSVMSMENMFYGCSSLASLDLSGLDASRSTGMGYMFYGCSSLASLDLSGLDTSSMKDMRGMFGGCKSLASLDLSDLDTSSVEDMGYMFSGCSSLASLDLSGLDTSSVTNMYGLFNGCSSLSRISLGPGVTRLDVLPAYKVAGHADWYSTAERRWFTSSEIASTRLGVADVYLKVPHPDISLATVTVPDQAFSGSALEPAPEVVQDGGTLEPGTDYDVSYSDNVNAGSATVTVTGKGAYEGSKSATFEISPAELSSVTLEKTSYTYDGAQKSPAVTVRGAGGAVLEDGADFTLSAPPGRTDAGTYAYTAEGKGNYTGTKTAEFAISPASIASASIAVADQEYTSKTLEPAPTVKLGSATLKAGTDYTVSYSDNVDVGTATAAVTGKGNYAGSSKATFEILPVRVEAPSALSFVYDESEKTGVVAGDGYELSGDVAASDAGSYFAVASLAYGHVWADGRSNDIVLAWSIAPASIAGATLTGLADAVYTGGVQVQAPVVELGGRALTEGKDYLLSYRDNVAVGTATVTATGVGNYQGSASATFEILPSGKNAADVRRLWGQNALETMSAIVDEGGFKKGGTVMVATKDDYYDALTAAGYAGLADAPVLLTAKGSLSPETSAQIKKLAPTRIVVCGGTAAVSANVEGQLRAAAPKATVERAWGQNAIGTANDVALRAAKSTGKRFSGACFVATPNGYWDALAAAPVAYALGMPVFLANFDGTIDGATLKAMRELGITRAYVAGGYMALPKTVESQLAAAKVKVEKRFAGRNACDTSRLIAEFGFSQGLSADRMGVATRDGYWDALCGAALCGHNRSVLVLAADDDRSAIDGFVRSHADDIAVAYVFGGSAAVSDGTFRAVETAAR